MLGKGGMKLWNDHIENGICAYSFLFWTACMKRYAQNSANDALFRKEIAFSWGKRVLFLSEAQKKTGI